MDQPILLLPDNGDGSTVKVFQRVNEGRTVLMVYSEGVLSCACCASPFAAQGDLIFVGERCRTCGAPIVDIEGGL